MQQDSDAPYPCLCQTFAEADLAATQANGLQIQEGDTLTVKLDNRTAQQVQESQNTKVAQSMIKSGQRPIAQQFTLTTPQFSPMPQFGMVQPQGQKAMRRITPAVPNTRFQPYQVHLYASCHYIFIVFQLYANYSVLWAKCVP